MAFAWIVQIGLFENKWHTEDAFPEINRCLPICTDKRDVVHSLRLDLAHYVCPFLSIFSPDVVAGMVCLFR